MDKDIKILKDLIKRCKNCNLHECINCEISFNEVKAIENIIETIELTKT